jgi:hypothetical protein
MRNLYSGTKTELSNIPHSGGLHEPQYFSTGKDYLTKTEGDML